MVPVFLASCRYNGTINWIIRTDCGIPINSPENIKFIPISVSAYIANVSERLNIKFRPAGNYKICDVKPMCGDLYRDEIADYDCYGFGDLDIIYGDIRKFYTDDILSYDVISTHEWMLSGHLTLFKNVDFLRKAYLKIPNWKKYLETPQITRFDEDVYSQLFISRFRDLIKRLLPKFFSRASSCNALMIPMRMILPICGELFVS